MNFSHYLDCARQALGARLSKHAVLGPATVSILAAMLLAGIATMGTSSFALASSDVQPVQNENEIVERWHGTIYSESAQMDSYAPCGATGVGTCPGDFHRMDKQVWELDVYADGSVRGNIRSTLLDYSYRQSEKNILCGPVAETNFYIYDCTYAPQVIQPNGVVFVEGKREIEQSTNLPVLRLESVSYTQECRVLWSSKGIHELTGAIVHKEGTAICNSFGVPRRFVIEVDEAGGQPRIDLTRSSAFANHRSSSWGQLVATVGKPLLTLDRELLERSVFLHQVPVEELFTANLNWYSPGGGWITWQLAEDDIERLGPSAAAEFPKSLEVGVQGVGSRQLSVQARNSLGQTSRPETTGVTVAPAPQWSGNPATISATKVEGAVSYKNSLKFPEPAFSGSIAVPSLVPWFGGKQMGISETQGALDWEVLSTSEGQGKLSGQTGFEAMGGTVIGALGGHANVLLNRDGVEISDGGMDFSIAGKLESEPQPLLQVVPALNPALVALEKISPAAGNFVKERANAKLEIQPQLGFGFNFFSENDEIKFKDAQAKPAFGFKTIANINLIEDVLAATAAIGGEIAVLFQVPEPYFQEATLKGLVQAQLVLYRWLWEGERSWSVAIGPGGAAAAGTQIWESHSAVESWQPLSRAYLDDDNYALWVGDEESDATDDTRLVENVFPLANPALAVRVFSNGDIRATQAWVHDTPAGGDIAYATAFGSGQMGAPGFVTDENDAHDDLAPKVAYVSDQTTMFLWQRMDTPTPPDINDDPAGYLSHWQIFARLSPTVSDDDRPLVQLSQSGSLNYRHQLASTADGALAVWVNNPANQIFGDIDNPDHILFSQYTFYGSNAWSTPAPVLSDVAGLLSMDLATIGQHGAPDYEGADTNYAALVYSRDIDGDSATQQDTELFYVIWDGVSWSAPVRLTDNEVPDEFPQLVLDAEGAPALVWRQGNMLKFLHGDWQAMPVDLPLPGAAEHMDYKLVRGPDGQLALIWQEIAPDSAAIGYALYDAEYARWSLQRTIPVPASANDAPATVLPTQLAAALVPVRERADDQGRLLVAYQLAHAESFTPTVDGIEIPNVPQVNRHDLHLARWPLTINLSVTPNDLSASAANVVQAVIHNTGDLSVQDVPIVLHIGPADPESGIVQAITQTLPLVDAGKAATLTFQLPESAIDAALFSVHIDPQRTLAESDVADNMAVLGNDLQIALLPAYYGPQGIIMRAEISRHGPLYTSQTITSQLTLDAPDGPIFGGSQIGFPLTPTHAITVSAFISPTGLGPGRHQFFWTVDPEHTRDRLPSDNHVVSTLLMILPDLAADPDLIEFNTSNTGADFRMVVQNLGNWPNEGGFVEVFDGLPGKTDAQSLLRLPLPQIAPGEYAELMGTLERSALSVAQTKLSAVYVLLDPDETVDEINENNNLLAAGDVLERTDLPTDSFRLNLPMVQR